MPISSERLHALMSETERHANTLQALMSELKLLVTSYRNYPDATVLEVLLAIETTVAGVHVPGLERLTVERYHLQKFKRYNERQKQRMATSRARKRLAAKDARQEPTVTEELKGNESDTFTL